MEHSSAKWRHDDAADDAPVQQPMREATKPVQRRNPTADQKRVRREMARKTAADDRGRTHDICSNCGEAIHDAGGIDPNLPWVHEHSGNSKCDVDQPADAVMLQGVEMSEASPMYHQSSIDRAGDRECQACGHTGAPVLADTGPACRRCGSYSLKRSPYKPQPSRDAASVPAQGDYARSAAKASCENCGKSITSTIGDKLCTECRLSLGDEKPEDKTAGLRTEATQFQTNVATSDGRVLLQPGDNIRTPTGQTMKVNQVRRHETSRDHYYVDTDAGTTVVPWSTNFEVVPQNQRQQELPGFGVPGANSNALPFDPETSGSSNQPSSPNSCPVCGTKGSMRRSGNKYICSKCGYSENYMGGRGDQGMAFTDSPQVIMQNRASKDHRSVVARRAAEMLDQMKETPL
jgi:predicted RNA-binding Zn-ribbon protein involved in translation (DUF1610 family)